MPSDIARRGRPRGSGLDDRMQLKRLSDMLESDPALKPTTAIKALGVTDPSTIRRLREKLKADAPAHRAPVPAAHSWRPAEAAEPHPKPLPQSPASALACAMQAAVVSEAATSVEASFLLLMRWYALGLSALSSAVDAHLELMDGFLRVPQAACALRDQLELNEVANAFRPGRADVRPTLH